MIEVVQDDETVNPYCDLTIVGSKVYAQHWATEVIEIRYQVEQSPIYLWTPSAPRVDWVHLKQLAEDPRHLFVRFGDFEKDIWDEIMVPVYGFPPIPMERWHDIQAVCALKAVPLSLEKTLPPLCGREKDTEGSKLTIGLSRFGNQRMLWREHKGHPRSKGGVELKLPERTPELMARIYDYCRQDVADETALHKRVGYLPPAEREVWLLDQVINERGVKLDREFLAGAQKIVDAARGPLENEFRLLTGGIGPGQTAKVIEWAGGQGVALDNLQKATISELLGERDDDDEDVPGRQVQAIHTLPEHVRRALAIRQLVGSASIRKLSRMAACIAIDGRAHRLSQYHGTGPGRWAGRLFNHLNFPRGTAVRADNHKAETPNLLAEALRSGRLSEVNNLGLVVEDPPLSGQWRDADPIEVVSSALRHAIVAEPGKRLVVGDFVQIQARIVLALAGQTDFLEKLAAGMDPYCLTAEAIHGKPEGTWPDKDHCPPGMRHDGKGAFLGCGFELGATTYCQKHMRGCLCKPGTRPCEHPFSEPRRFAGRTVRAYREGIAPKVADTETGLWRGLEEAALRAVYSDRNQRFEAFGIIYQKEDGWLTARLLDGKKIYYWNPTLSTRAQQAADYGREDARADDKLCWKYQTVKQGRFVWTYAYGGLLAENAVMGMERQLLVRAMLRCEKEHLPVIFNGYDENVCEVDEARASFKHLQQIMEDDTGWPRDLSLPIACEGWTGPCYKKG